ncbi:hypothetical protein Tco_1525453 [Tanacetum coccineum]
MSALTLAKKISLVANQEKGEGQAPVGGVAIRDPVSETTPKLPEVVGKGKAIWSMESSSTTDSETTESGTESRLLLKKTRLDQTLEKAHEALAGPDPEPMQKDQTGIRPLEKYMGSNTGPNPGYRMNNSSL